MSEVHPVCGVWEMIAEDAPFGYHVMTFHPDGTMLQSNPDAGNRVTSDSNGMGWWRVEGGRVWGAFVEFSVDRGDSNAVRRGVVEFSFTVFEGRLEGSATATFHSIEGARLGVPATTALTGRRFGP